MAIEYTNEEMNEARPMARWDRPLAKGTYEAEVVDAMVHAGPKGDCGKFVFEITSASDVEAPEGPVKIDHYASTALSVKEIFQAFEPEMLLQPRIVLDPGRYVGGRCRVVVTHEDWQGKAQSKVSRVLPLEATRPAASKPASKEPTPPPPAPKAAFSPFGDDGSSDIPF